jgi:chitodextrinase
MSLSLRVRKMLPSGELDFASPARRRAARRRKRMVRAVIAAFAMTFTFVLATVPNAQAASKVPVAAAADTAAPTVPGDFGASINCALVVTLHWTASTDDVGVTGYDVYRSIDNAPFALVRTTSTTTFTESLLGIVKYQVRARDAAGNASGFTAVANIVPPPCQAPRDTQPPSTPGGIIPSVGCTLVVTLNWGASTDNVAVIGYDVYRSINNGPFSSVATTSATTFTESLLGIVKYQVRARDTSANVSAFTAAVQVVPPPCPPPDTQPPTTPGTPTASGTTASATTLTWSASTDNLNVTGYDIYRAPGPTGDTFAPVGTSAYTAFTDAGLTTGTTYRYEIRARDAAGNVSAFSPAVAVTPSAGGCTASLNVQTSWYNGYVMQPNTVTNNGSSDLNGWTVTFTLPPGHTITGSWNAVVTVTGQTVTVRGIVGQNAILGAGATTTWGLRAKRPAGDSALPSGGVCASP